jgi:phage tail sheath protein FI
MPVTPTYPGVYVEEIPSGVRTITGVATSITAFVGFAQRGPTNEPVRIQNFGDFERTFGGLAVDSTMSYAVQHFFQHGGSDAIIVRLSNSGVRATLDLGNGIVLEAIVPGDDGNKLKATVTYPENSDKTFNLTIATENPIENIDPNDVPKSLGNSKLVRLKAGSNPTARPASVSDQPFTGGRAAATSARISLPTGASKPPLVLQAVSEGDWGNQLQAIVDHVVANPSDSKAFNLTIQFVDGDSITSETIRNLSVDPASTRYAVEVIKAESNFVRVDESQPMPSDRPTAPEPPAPPAPPVKSDKQGSNGAPPQDDLFYIGNESQKTGLYALEKADLFNLLCIPPVNRSTEITTATFFTALAYCVKRRAILIVDPPAEWTDTTKAETGIDDIRKVLGAKPGINATVYFPRLKLADPLKENRTQEFVPCGAIAGIIARTDASRGVWKAPAGIDATFSGVRELTYKLTDGENGRLNPKGLNCLRVFPVYGNVIWGARTLAGDDRLASEWKYLPVRRLALFLEESLYRGTQWVVFEPNDEPLWAQIRLNIGAFMNNLFRQGAFQGKTPKEAYFVKCDSETTTQNDINLGIVNIVIGFAPLKPAEFVILKFQQMAGQVAA